MSAKEKLLTMIRERIDKAQSTESEVAYEVVLDFAITHLPDIEIDQAEMFAFILWLRDMDRVEDEGDIIAAWNIWKMELAASEGKSITDVPLEQMANFIVWLRGTPLEDKKAVIKSWNLYQNDLKIKR